MNGFQRIGRKVPEKKVGHVEQLLLGLYFSDAWPALSTHQSGTP